MADDLLKSASNQVGKAAVGSADFAIEADRHQHIVERVDQVAITLLRTLDDGEKLVELLIAGRRGIALLNAANEPAQFGDLLVPLPGIDHEGDDDDHHASQQSLVTLRERTESIPLG